MPFVASQMIGLIMARYVLEIEPLASLPADDVVAVVAPTIQRYLEMPLPDGLTGRALVTLPTACTSVTCQRCTDVTEPRPAGIARRPATAAAA